MATIGYNFRVTTELRDRANEAALAIGIPLGEYLRRALVHLADSGSNPFPQCSGVRSGIHTRKATEADKQAA